MEDLSFASSNHSQSRQHNLVQSHKRALQRILKRGTYPANAVQTSEERLKQRLTELRFQKAGLLAKLREASLVRRENIADKVHELVEKASEFIQRPYLHEYDRGAAGHVANALQSKKRKFNEDSRYDSYYDENKLVEMDDLVKERKRRKLMGAHRLTGLSLFAILDESKSWYVGARIDTTENGGSFNLKDCVHYAFFELMSNRWDLKNHTLPHCLRIDEAVKEFGPSFEVTASSVQKLWALNTILREMHNMVHAFEMRSANITSLRKVGQTFNVENLSVNEAFTLLSFQINFQLKHSENNICLLMKAIYTDKRKVFPTKVNITFDQLNLRNATLDTETLASACAYNFKTRPLIDAVKKVHSLIENYLE